MAVKENMEDIKGLKELAWLYTEFRKVLNSMPSSISDFIEDVPYWVVIPDDYENGALYAMIDVADETARDVLKNTPL